MNIFSPVVKFFEQDSSAQATIDLYIAIVQNCSIGQHKLSLLDTLQRLCVYIKDKEPQNYSPLHDQLYEELHDIFSQQGMQKSFTQNALDLAANYRFLSAKWKSLDNLDEKDRLDLMYQFFERHREPIKLLEKLNIPPQVYAGQSRQATNGYNFKELSIIRLLYAPHAKRRKNHKIFQFAMQEFPEMEVDTNVLKQGIKLGQCYPQNFQLLPSATQQHLNEITLDIAVNKNIHKLKLHDAIIYNALEIAAQRMLVKYQQVYGPYGETVSGSVEDILKIYCQIPAIEKLLPDFLQMKSKHAKGNRSLWLKAKLDLTLKEQAHHHKKTKI